MDTPTTDFMVVLESSTDITPGDTDDSVVPANPMRAGRIRYFSADAIDRAFASAAMHPDTLIQRIAAKIRIGGRPLAGTGANDFVPLRSLIGVPGERVPFDIGVTRDTEIEAEFKSLDDAASAVPDIFVKLIAHCEDA